MCLNSINKKKKTIKYIYVRLVVLTLLEELIKRSGLTVALSGRDETSLEHLLAFTARYACNFLVTIP